MVYLSFLLKLIVIDSLLNIVLAEFLIYVRKIKEFRVIVCRLETFDRRQSCFKGPSVLLLPFVIY